MASAAAGTRDDGIGNAKRRLYTRRFAVFCKAESRLLQNVSRPFARQKAAFHGAKLAYLERLKSLENFRHRVTRCFPSSYAKTQKPGLFPSKAMLLHAGSPPEASTVIVCASRFNNIYHAGGMRPIRQCGCTLPYTHRAKPDTGKEIKPFYCAINLEMSK